MVRGPPRATLFPCTTLFQSDGEARLYLLLGWLVAGLQVVDGHLDALRADVRGMLGDQSVHGLRAQVAHLGGACIEADDLDLDRKSTRLNSSHANISYAVFCL